MCKGMSTNCGSKWRCVKSFSVIELDRKANWREALWMVREVRYVGLQIVLTEDVNYRMEKERMNQAF